MPVTDRRWLLVAAVVSGVIVAGAWVAHREPAPAATFESVMIIQHVSETALPPPPPPPKREWKRRETGRDYA